MSDQTNLPAMMPLNDMMRLAESIAKSRLFGITTPDQALVLMSIAQAEGRHPALAARDYHIIQGAPAKKAEAMARDFLSAGGRIQWHQLDDTTADATFSHPAGGSARIKWDQERVTRAGLGSNQMHKKYPRQMLRSRVVSEGVRTVWPMATSGMYVPEEIAEGADAAPQREPIDVTPKADVAGDVPSINELIAAGDIAADGGTDNFIRWWNDPLVKPYREDLKSRLDSWRVLAQAADARGGPAPDDDDGRDAFGLLPIDKARAAQNEPLDGTVGSDAPARAGTPADEATSATEKGVAALGGAPAAGGPPAFYPGGTNRPFATTVTALAGADGSNGDNGTKDGAGPIAPMSASHSESADLLGDPPAENLYVPLERDPDERALDFYARQMLAMIAERPGDRQRNARIRLVNEAGIERLKTALPDAHSEVRRALRAAPLE